MSHPDGDSPALDPAQLHFLTAIQDRLIPRERDMPGAGELGGAQVVAGYLPERPALHRDITAALGAIETKSSGHASAGSGTASFERLEDGEKDAVLRQVEAEMPREFEVLWKQTYNSYYTNEAIQQKLGAGALPPQPHGYAMSAFDESRLDAVKKRGKLWRDA